MNTTRWLVATAATVLLCACNSAKLPANTAAASAPQPANAAKPAQAGETTTATAFREHIVIKPSESVEKDQLQVSYSLKAVPNDANALLLSLTFRNLKNKNVKLHPRIVLLDAADKPIAAHDKHAFITQAKLESARAVAKGGDLATQRAQLEEKTKWANRFWLKERFTIPANGIEVGEIVFHCQTACQPKQLNVYHGKQEFPFTLSGVAR